MGEEFIEGGFLKGSPALVYKHGEWQIRLDTYTKDSGNSNRTYTRVRAPFINKDELYFKIYREGFFSDMGKFLGMQDIKTGDPFFDEQFIIKSNNRKKLKLFLADPKIKELIQSQPKIHLEIRVMKDSLVLTIWALVGIATGEAISDLSMPPSSQLVLRRIGRQELLLPTSGTFFTRNGVRVIMVWLRTTFRHRCNGKNKNVLICRSHSDNY